jgi:hypothetical protein
MLASALADNQAACVPHRAHVNLAGWQARLEQTTPVIEPHWQARGSTVSTPSHDVDGVVVDSNKLS